MNVENASLTRDESVSASIIVTDRNLYETALKKKEAAKRTLNEKNDMLNRISSLEEKMDLILSAINKLHTDKN